MALSSQSRPGPRSPRGAPLTEAGPSSRGNGAPRTLFPLSFPCRAEPVLHDLAVSGDSATWPAHVFSVPPNPPGSVTSGRCPPRGGVCPHLRNRSTFLPQLPSNSLTFPERRISKDVFCMKISGTNRTTQENESVDLQRPPLKPGWHWLLRTCAPGPCLFSLSLALLR